MCCIDENVNKVGYGSWFVSQTYNDFRGRMTVREWQLHLYNKCKERIQSLSIKQGDIISITYIGGHKPKKYTCEVANIFSYDLQLKMKSRVLTFNISLIDDIQIIGNAKKLPKFIATKKTKKQTIKEIPMQWVIEGIRKEIDAALDAGNREEFLRLTEQLKKKIDR